MGHDTERIPLHNPAVWLRASLRTGCPRCMVRYDTTGRALLLSDAPQRGVSIAPLCASLGAVSSEANGLAYIDLSADGYAKLIHLTCTFSGDFQADFFEEQSLLASLLWQNHAAHVEIPLLRDAMVSSALGDVPMLAFLHRLSAHHAHALRSKSPHACRAAAVLCADALYARHGIGIPKIHTVNFKCT